VDFVVLENLRRRDLTAAQRAMISADAEDLKTKLRTEAEQRLHLSPGRPTKEEKPVQKVGRVIDDHSGRTDTKIAEAYGTNREYVRKARKIKQTAPQVAELVRADTKP
jgi:hypothetical protein